MTSRARLAGLPAVALVLVSGVLGVQLANGGGTFEPLQPADPCVARTVTSQAEGIDGLTERLVLLGIDGAACRLGRQPRGAHPRARAARPPHGRPDRRAARRACWPPSTG